ncbi:hypothetical protein FS837_008362, partial [Tulasnella sp. UAMH 9824]
MLLRASFTLDKTCQYLLTLVKSYKQLLAPLSSRVVLILASLRSSAHRRSPNPERELSQLLRGRLLPAQLFRATHICATLLYHRSIRHRPPPSLLALLALLALRLASSFRQTPPPLQRRRPPPVQPYYLLSLVKSHKQLLSPYPGLPPVPNPSPLSQPREETFATSPRPTATRPTFSGNPPPRQAPLPPVDPTPTAFLPRSPRSPRPARFHPPTTSTPLATSRPTFSPNPSIGLTPQSFDGTPSTDRSPRISPLLQPSKEITAASTPSTTPYPTSSPNQSLLTPPQSANTTSTIISSQLSLTLQHSEHTTDDSAAARKIADLRATIAVLQRKRDDYLDSVQHELRNRICPR